MEILDKARKAVPAVNYALGVAGVAAAAALVTLLVGNTNSSIILLSSSFVGMILLFVFSKLVVSPAPSIQFAGIVLVWLILAFFATFLLFTTTAFVSGWPCNWAQILGLKNGCIALGQKQFPLVPAYINYRSEELGVTLVFPNNVLSLDTTERARRELSLRDGEGQTIVKVSRTALTEPDVKLARENELAQLKRMNLAVTYVAPERDSNWSNWYVLSGLSHGTEFYFRRWHCPNSVVSIEFTYDKQAAPLIDGLIPKMTQEVIIADCGR